ncbi:hypothetical protein D3C81_798110 [compost metagenome]
MTMLSDFRQGHAAAETGHIGVFANFTSDIQRLTAPIGHGLGNAFNISVEQFDLYAADVSTEFARIDKQYFTWAGYFLFGEEP